MSETKRIVNMGWATAEKHMMKKLARNAEKGWVLAGGKQGIYTLKLEKAPPQTLQYAVDWQCNLPDEDEYLAFCRAAGWSLAAKQAGGFYIFSAPVGTTKLHTDKTHLQALRKGRIKSCAARSVVYFALVAAIIFATSILKMPAILNWLLVLAAVFCGANLGFSLTLLVSFARQQNNF